MVANELQRQSQRLVPHVQLNIRDHPVLIQTNQLMVMPRQRVHKNASEKPHFRYFQISVNSTGSHKSPRRTKISVEFMESRTAKHIARYEAQLVDGVETGVLFIPKDVTKYEILHEIAHIRHHFDQGAGFRRLTEAAREKHVYDQLLGSPYWQFFTAEQKVDAFMQYKNAVNRVRR
jgi:hypothetical protein